MGVGVVERESDENVAVPYKGDRKPGCGCGCGGSWLLGSRFVSEAIVLSVLLIVKKDQHKQEERLSL